MEKSISALAEEILKRSPPVIEKKVLPKNSLFIDEGNNMPDISKLKPRLEQRNTESLPNENLESSLQSIVESLKIIADRLDEITTCGSIGTNFSTPKKPSKKDKKKRILSRLKKYGSL